MKVHEIIEPFAGEKPGIHTRAAMERLIGYLQTETGEKFVPYGSLKNKISSDNDIDIALVPSDEETDLEAYYQKEQEAWDRINRGESTPEEEGFVGDIEHPIDTAMFKLGFSFVKEMNWLGIAVFRYRNEKTNHNVDIWTPYGDPDRMPS